MSKRTSILLSTLALLVAVSPLSAQARGGDDGGVAIASFANAGACSTHAWLLRQACSADRRDDFLVHLADCEYVVPEDEARNCRDQARDERNENSEECEAVYEARLDLCELVGEDRYLPSFDPLDFVDPDDIGDGVDPNPYWPLGAGHTHVIVGGGEVTVVTATDEVRDVGGLPCRVIRDLVFEEEEDDGEVAYEAVEVTQDWYGQLVDGDVVYCGENTYEIEDGLIDNTDGSFAHLTDRAQAGVLIRRFPGVGEGNRQEMATDEAEDYVEYVSLATSPSAAEGGEAANYPCDGGCLQTFEKNPRDPDGAEYKYYKPGFGFVLATKLDEDGVPTGEREEVTCIGDSLDVLDDPSCGVADPDALREALCLWSPEALCGEEED